MKIIIVINFVCKCVKTSVVDDDLQSLPKREREREREREHFITLNYSDAMYVQFEFWLCFTMRSNDTFNFLPGWIKYILCYLFCGNQYSAVFAFGQCDQKLNSCSQFHVSEVNESWYLKLFSVHTLVTVSWIDCQAKRMKNYACVCVWVWMCVYMCMCL